MEHFEELLNRTAPQNPPDIPPADRTLPIDCNKPTKEEIRNAIRQLKKGKAAGPDNIPAEALTFDVRRSGKRNKYHQNGKKATSLRSQRKATLVPAQTTEELRSCPSHERYSTESS